MTSKKKIRNSVQPLQEVAWCQTHTNTLTHITSLLIAHAARELEDIRDTLTPRAKPRHDKTFSERGKLQRNQHFAESRWISHANCCNPSNQCPLTPRIYAGNQAEWTMFSSVNTPLVNMWWFKGQFLSFVLRLDIIVIVPRVCDKWIWVVDLIPLQLCAIVFRHNLDLNVVTYSK